MTTRSFQIALSGALLALGSCVVAPRPMVAPPVVVAQQNCRQFTQTITVAGNSQPGYGVECLQPDGTWRIVTPVGPTPSSLPPVTEAVPYPPYVPYAYGPYYDGYPDYWYPDYFGYPWYFGPEIGIGIGVGRGWHGGGGWGGGHGGGHR